MFVMVRCTYVSCLFESISLKFARFNTKISFYVNVMNSAIDKQDDLIQKEKKCLLEVSCQLSSRLRKMVHCWLHAASRYCITMMLYDGIIEFREKRKKEKMKIHVID